MRNTNVLPAVPDVSKMSLTDLRQEVTRLRHIVNTQQELLAAERRKRKQAEGLLEEAERLFDGIDRDFDEAAEFLTEAEEAIADDADEDLRSALGKLSDAFMYAVRRGVSNVIKGVHNA